MAELSIGGISFRGGKMMAIILALGSSIGVLYGGFEAFKKFQDMSAAIEAYQEPDLSGFDKKIALVESNTNAQIALERETINEPQSCYIISHCFTFILSDDNHIYLKKLRLTIPVLRAKQQSCYCK